MSDVDVSLILTRYGGEVLLVQRRSAGLGDHLWLLPGGTPAAGEHPLAAVLRRTHESVDLRLAEQDVRLATVVYWHTGVVSLGSGCSSPPSMTSR